jgi:hypothetical protein
LWIDEVFYLDPAINLAKHGSFTSTACYFHNESTFWAGNVPGYPLLLSLWFNFVEPSLLNSRLIGYILICISALLFLDALKKLGLIRGHVQTSLLLCTFLFTPSVAFVYRSARMESLAILIICTMIWLIANQSRNKSRWIALGILSFLLAWSHILTSLAVGIVVMIYAVVERNRDSYQHLISIASGGFFGALTLAGLHYFMGSIDEFISALTFVTPVRDQSIAHYGIPGYASGFAEKIKKAASIIAEPSVLVVLLVATLTLFKSTKIKIRKYIYSCYFVILILPTILFSVSKFELFYRWIPFIGGIFLLLLAWKDHLPNWQKTAFASLLFLASMLGLPRYLIDANRNFGATSYHDFSTNIENNFTCDDIALVDYPAYLTSKSISSKTYLPQYLKYLSKESLSEISVIACKKKSSAEIFKYLPISNYEIVQTYPYSKGKDSSKHPLWNIVIYRVIDRPANP